MKATATRQASLTSSTASVTRWRHLSCTKTWRSKLIGTDISEHVLAHVRSGDQSPLARVLLTTAKRAAAAGNLRLAFIDATTAAEVALTSGLSDQLSTEANSRVAQVSDGARQDARSSPLPEGWDDEPPF